MAQDKKVMIITGASSGFGYLTARMAAQQGYRVVVAARRAERLDALVAEIAAAGGEALAVPGDITREEDQQRLIDQTLAHFGRIDVLVNNAGVPLKGNFADESVAALRSQWETNVTSIVLLTRRALPALTRTKGVVINVGSIAGRFSLPQWGLYYPSKVAVASISDALRRELRPLGVRVSLVEPGPFDTEFANRAGMPSGGLPPEQVSRAILRIAARPKARVMVPGWAWLLVAPTSLLVQLLPGLVDVICWALISRRQRTSSQSVVSSQ